MSLPNEVQKLLKPQEHEFGMDSWRQSVYCCMSAKAHANITQGYTAVATGCHCTGINLASV